MDFHYAKSPASLDLATLAGRVRGWGGGGLQCCAARSTTKRMSKQAQVHASPPFRRETVHHRSLRRLALMVTELCNLACPYCYEHREPEVFFASSPHMRRMSGSSALDVLERAYSLWPQIDAIFFFGGEPLLQRKLIWSLCKAVREGRIPGMSSQPDLAMITNGILLDASAVAMVQRFGIRLNISLDGPATINDLARIDRRGRGSSELVLANLRGLRDSGVEYEIEATFSRYHLDAGLSIPDLMDYFFEEHGISSLHVPWVSSTPDNSYCLTPDEILGAYTLAVRYSFDNLRRGKPSVISFVNRWLRTLQAYEPEAARPYCPACFSDISVNATGDVYPCFMFNGVRHLKLGNIYDPEFFSSVNQAVVEAFYEAVYGACDCPPGYRAFHSGCIGQDRIAGGSILAKPFCGVQRELIDVFLEEVRKDATSSTSDRLVFAGSAPS